MLSSAKWRQHKADISLFQTKRDILSENYVCKHCFYFYLLQYTNGGQGCPGSGEVQFNNNTAQCSTITNTVQCSTIIIKHSAVQ